MQATNIFEFLDWILKKKGNEPIYEKNINSYILNRWLSMTNNFDLAKIINVTVNRWDKFESDSDNFLDICKFYKTILPHVNKKIDYIKKKNLKLENNDELEIRAKVYEMPKRELKIYDNLLEKINNKDN